MHPTAGWIVAIGVLVGLPIVAYVVELLRPQPSPPGRLSWAPDIPIRYVDVQGISVRCITTGSGPTLVLLHTLRTQLDMFQKVVARLAKNYRVVALDYPGHGFSQIPDVEYTPEFFVQSVAQFLDAMALQDVVIVGESIGATIGLILAARQNPRVRGVVAINPYDYDRGRGLRRSSWLANLLLAMNDVPILGVTFNRLRQYPIILRVFQGGVARRESIPDSLAQEMYRVGNRRGHLRGFMSLVRHWPAWEQIRVEYSRIQRPVLLIYGDHDWSRPEEREADRQAVPGAQYTVVPNAGHFLSLDAPDALLEGVTGFRA